MRRIVVDVDAGSDDAFALMLLLAGENRYSYRVEAITCTYGNTSLEYVTRNVLLILEAMKRTDVPVYKGAASSLLGKARGFPKFHGEDGFGDKTYPVPVIQPQEENAVSAINRITTQHEDVVIICLGPLTNLALALRTYPSLRDNMGQLWVMGGNTKAVGNVNNTTAEFNFFHDPEAAHIVFDVVKCPTTVLPWEPCIDVPITVEFRFDTLGKTSTKHMELLNKVEENLYNNSTVWNPCDALLAATFADEQTIKSSRKVHLAVELSGIYTRGQCVILPKNETNVRVIDELNFVRIKEMFVEVAEHLC